VGCEEPRGSRPAEAERGGSGGRWPGWAASREPERRRRPREERGGRGEGTRLAQTPAAKLP